MLTLNTSVTASWQFKKIMKMTTIVCHLGGWQAVCSEDGRLSTKKAYFGLLGEQSKVS